MHTIEELLESGRLVRARELEENKRKEQERDAARENRAASYRAAVDTCVQDALPPELVPFSFTRDRIPALLAQMRQGEFSPVAPTD